MNFSTTALAFLTLLQSKSGFVNAAKAKRALGKSCQGDDKIELEFKAGCYPDELSWELQQNGDVIESGDGFDDEDQTYLYEFCVDPFDGCVDFIFTDSYGDGMACGGLFGGGEDGYFKLSLNGQEVFMKSGDWGFRIDYAFPCGPELGGGGSDGDGGSDYDYDYYYNPFITMCDDAGDVGTYIYLELGSYPGEISWELTDTGTGDVVASKDYSDLMLDYDYLYYYDEANFFYWTGNLFSSLFNGTNFTDDLFDDGWSWDDDIWANYTDDGSYTWDDDWEDYGYFLYPAALAYHEVCYPPACLELTVSDNVAGDGLDYMSGGYGYYIVVNEGEYVAYEDGDFGEGSTVSEFCTDTAAPTEAPVESAESSDGDPIGAIFALLEELFRILLALFG
jgi:hypothetical protein